MISSAQIEKQICIPTVRWYQNKEYVIMSFDVYNGKNENIKINEDDIHFHMSTNDIEYKMNFNFFENIDIEESKYEIMDKCVKFVLKKTSDNSWTFLTNDKNIYKNNIKIDWNGWTDDSDDEINNEQQFDFQKMMENMQGMGGMENMFGGEEGDNYEGEEGDNYEEEEGDNYEGEEGHNYEDDEDCGNYEENNNEEDNNEEDNNLED
jgi:hypothetical protein